MARQPNDILGIEGRVGPMTAYTRNGKKYCRVAHNRKTRRLTRKQLAVRERQSHNNALWQALKATNHVYFEGGENTMYNHFMSINMESPIPYFPKGKYHSGLALLLPNMILSNGPLPPVNYQLGEIDNPIGSADSQATIPALLTDLTMKEVRKGEYLLYVLKQQVNTPQGWDDMPYLSIHVETLALGDLIPWAFECLVGIAPDPAQPGFKHIIMRPDFSIRQLDGVTATYPSVYGDISSRWQRTDGNILWKVTIPANTTATLHLPNGKQKEVKSGT